MLNLMANFFNWKRPLSKFRLLKLKFRTYNNSNTLNSMVILTFAGFDCTRPFWAMLLHKICLSWISYIYKSEYVEFENDIYVFCFEPEIPFLEKPVLNYQSCYKISKIFVFIVSSFLCFGESVKTPVSVSALRSFMV